MSSFCNCHTQGQTKLHSSASGCILVVAEHSNTDRHYTASVTNVTFLQDGANVSSLKLSKKSKRKQSSHHIMTSVSHSVCLYLFVPRCLLVSPFSIAHLPFFLPPQAKLQLSDFSLLGSFQLDLLTSHSPLCVCACCVYMKVRVCMCVSVFSVYVTVCDTLGKDTMVNSIKKPLIFQHSKRSQCPPTLLLFLSLTHSITKNESITGDS